MKSVIPGLLPVAAEWLSDLCWLVTQFVFSCSTILVPAFPSKKKKIDLEITEKSKQEASFYLE